MLYQHRNPSQRRRNVLLLVDAAAEKHIKSGIRGTHVIVEQLERRLENGKEMDETKENSETKVVLPKLEIMRTAIGVFEKFSADVSIDWKRRENRILGHVVLSPPIGVNIREDGSTEDWAVIEVDGSKVDMTSFIDFSGTISDGEMWEPSLKTRDQDNNPCIMVIKSGNTSDLTIGRLNTIRSCCRVYFEGQPGQVSKEVSVLPRNSENSELCASSEPGDSGSAVVDDKGRLAGLLTGGAGDTSIFDCTYLTSINFLLKRMLEYGLKANLYPSLSA